MFFWSNMCCATLDISAIILHTEGSVVSINTGSVMAKEVNELNGTLTVIMQPHMTFCFLFGVKLVVGFLEHNSWTLLFLHYWFSLFLHVCLSLYCWLPQPSTPYWCNWSKIKNAYSNTMYNHKCWEDKRPPLPTNQSWRHVTFRCALQQVCSGDVNTLIVLSSRILWQLAQSPVYQTNKESIRLVPSRIIVSTSHLCIHQIISTHANIEKVLVLQL